MLCVYLAMIAFIDIDVVLSQTFRIFILFYHETHVYFFLLLNEKHNFYYFDEYN